MHPPTSPDAMGWSFSSYKVGYRAAVVRTTGDTMKITFAPSETGPDSGLVAEDQTISKLSYSIYFPTARVADVKIPGCGAGIAMHARAPGWNVVEVGEKVSLNGVEICHGTPGDIGCYATGPRVPAFVFLTAFESTARPPAAVAPPPADAAPPSSRFRFAD